MIKQSISTETKAFVGSVKQNVEQNIASGGPSRIEAAVEKAILASSTEALDHVRSDLANHGEAAIKKLGIDDVLLAIVRSKLGVAIGQVAKMELPAGPEIHELVGQALESHVQKAVPMIQGLLGLMDQVDQLAQDAKASLADLAKARQAVEEASDKLIHHFASGVAGSDQLEASVRVLFKILSTMGLAPEGEGEATVKLLAESIHAAAWIRTHPSYKTVGELGSELTGLVTTTAAKRVGNESLLTDSVFRSELAEISHAQMIPGNKVRPIEDGPEFYKELKNLIKNCEGPLLLDYWSIYDDPTGKEIAELIKQRNEEGKETILMVDGKVSHRDHHGPETLPMLEALSNVEVIRVEDPDREPLGTHAKLAIDVKAMKCLSGGSNLGSEYTGFEHEGAPWTDRNALYEGPIVKAQMEYFNWMRKQHIEYGGKTKLGADFLDNLIPENVASVGDLEVGFIHNRPMETNNMLAGNLKMMEGVGEGETFTVNHCYFMMNEASEQAVRRLAQRDGKLELYLNTPDNLDEPNLAGAILASGKRALQIFEEEGKQGNCSVNLKLGAMMHNKLTIAGDQIVRTDSWNWHRRSATLEHEIGHALPDESLAQHELGRLQKMKANGEFKEIAKSEDLKLDPPGITGKLLRVFWDIL